MAVNKCVKYLLFIFNLLFWISGCIILGVSIYLKVDKENTLANEAVPGVDVLIAVGVIIMVLGFLGCCGAVRENRCMLLLFFIFLLLIFILLLAAGILGATSDEKVKDWITERMNKFLPLSSQPDNVKENLYKLQTKLKCCGLLKGATDWSPVPESCKCSGTGTTPDATCDPNTGTYSMTCTDRIIEEMEQRMGIVLGIAFAIAILMIFGMVLSMMLYCQIGKKDAATTTA